VFAFFAAVAVQAQPTGNCVTIGEPNPKLNYQYRYTDSSGGKSEYTNRWEQFSRTSSRLITTRANGKSEYTSQHQIVDDMLLLDSSLSVGTDSGGPFRNEMTYKPAAMGDPAYRVCAGKSWAIPAVTVNGRGRQGSFSTRTDPGTITITAINESVTVPAGTFQAVRYTKVTKGRATAAEEFWKSIEHGVSVKHTYRVAGGGSEDVLIAIK
jgi:hypothetical protein